MQADLWSPCVTWACSVRRVVSECGTVLLVWSQLRSRRGNLVLRCEMIKPENFLSLEARSPLSGPGCITTGPGLCWLVRDCRPGLWSTGRPADFVDGPFVVRAGVVVSSSCLWWQR